jgi:hypothetical protein
MAQHSVSRFAVVCFWPLSSFSQAPPAEGPTVKFSTTVTESSFGTAVVLPGALRGDLYHLPPESLRLPNFTKLRPVGSIYTHSLNIPPRPFDEGFAGVSTRNEWFAIDYYGNFYVEKPGRYEFVLTSDDGSKLYINGKTVIDNDGYHPVQEEFGSIKLSKGIHAIRVSYFQGPRYSIALVLGVRRPGEREWRPFSTEEYKPPPDLKPEAPKR